MYLVTGGAGFIGSNIVKSLLERGENVRAFDNLSSGRRRNIESYIGNPAFEFIEADLRDEQAVEAAMKGVKYVLHQGALPSVPRSIQDPLTSNNVNITGTLNVLEAARRNEVRRVVVASSSSVYGNTPILPKHEEMPVTPLSPYAITKYAQERYAQVYYSIYGLETVCLRYFNVFGPNQDPDSHYSAVIPKFIKAMLKGESPLVHGDGMQSRDFTYVANNVEANLLACHTPAIAGEVFNIACGERFTLLQLVEQINLILGKNIQPAFEESRIGDVKHSQADIKKIQKMMNFNVVADFATGLEKTVESLINEGY